jgi:hypothetical protein
MTTCINDVRVSSVVVEGFPARTQRRGSPRSDIRLCAAGGVAYRFISNRSRLARPEPTAVTTEGTDMFSRRRALASQRFLPLRWSVLRASERAAIDLAAIAGYRDRWRS